MIDRHANTADTPVELQRWAERTKTSLPITPRMLQTIGQQVAARRPERLSDQYLANLELTLRSDPEFRRRLAALLADDSK